MVSNYIVLALFLVVLFSFTHENSRYAATASAIRQVWTGHCHLGCRASTVSDGGTSGLSGLVVPVRVDQIDCCCESCPCALIEEVLKTCGPATRLYHSSSNAVSQCYSEIAKKFQAAYNRMNSVLECRTSCRKHAQVPVTSRSSSFDPNTDFRITDRRPSDRPKPKPFSRQYGIDISRRTSEGSSLLPPPYDPEIMARCRIEPSTSTTPSSPNTPSRPPLKTTSFQEQLRMPSAPRIATERKPLSEEELRSGVDSKRNCSKCVEQGKVCIGGCPSAELKKKTYKK